MKPEIEEAKGIGTRSIFSLKNLLELVTIKEILKFGNDLNTIKQIKDKMDKSDIFGYVLREEYKEAKFLYIKFGKKIELELREEQLDPEFATGQFHSAYSPADDQLDPGVYMAVRLELGKLAKDLIEKIENY